MSEEYLIQLRKRLSQISNGNHNIKNQDTNFDNTTHQKSSYEGTLRNHSYQLLSLDETQSNFLPATSLNGKRLYLKSIEPSFVAKNFSQRKLNKNDDNFYSKSLLTKPYRDIYLEAEKMDEIRNQVYSGGITDINYYQENGELTNSVLKKNDFGKHNDTPVKIAETSNTPVAITPTKDIRLWTDKYKAMNYIDLMSEETINRTILAWFKSWDKCVFGDKRDSSGYKRKMNEEQKIGVSKLRMTSKGPFFNNRYTTKLPTSDDHIFELGSDNKPLQKIAIVWGPPGLGKTTLAHTIARHCGYKPVEINASDDRSPEAFTNVIESVIQTHSITGADSRPKCLIIDEIDGASTAAITTLVNLLRGADAGGSAQSTATTPGDVSLANGTPPRSFGKRGSDPKFGKKGVTRKGKITLNRPIICLANDLYVPALRPLRQMSLVLHLDSVPSQRLIMRLKQISSMEGLSFDSDRVLATLCDNLENDVRSCINCLQFVKSKVSRPRSIAPSDPDPTTKLTLDDVIGDVGSDVDGYAGGDGTKDRTYDLKKLLETVFTKRVAGAVDSTVPFLNGPSTSATRSKPADLQTYDNFTKILTLAIKIDDKEKAANSLFENYLNIPYKDGLYMEHTLYGLDWLSTFHDTLSKHMSHTQNYSFYKYLNYLYVTFHLNMAAAPQYFSKPFKAVYGASAFRASVPPRSLREALVPHSSKNFEILTSTNRIIYLVGTVLRNVSPKIRPFLTFDLVCIDVSPFLVEIIKPNLRQVNYQLFTSPEKVSLASVVSVMLTYDLGYKQERRLEPIAVQPGGPGGRPEWAAPVSYHYHYALEPNIEEVAYFKPKVDSVKPYQNSATPNVHTSGPTPTTKYELSYGVKQVIQQHITVAKLKMIEESLKQRPTFIPPNVPRTNHHHSDDSLSESTPNRHQIGTSLPDNMKRLSNHVTPDNSNPGYSALMSNLQKFKHTNGWDDTSTASLKFQNQPQSNGMGLPTGVTYVYKHGYTNAVRRFVKIRDILK